MLDIKEIRKNIRKCMTNTELTKLISVLEFMGYFLEVKRYNSYEPCDTKNASIKIRDKEYNWKNNHMIYVALPPDWSCTFKDVRHLSYNIRLNELKCKF